MLKVNLLLLLLLTADYLRGQVFLSQREFEKAPSDWSKEYASLPSSNSIHIGAEIGKVLNGQFLKYSQKSQIVNLFLFLNNEGKIDYLVHETGGDIPADTVDRIFKTQLREFFSSFSMKGVDKKVQLAMFFRTGGTPKDLVQQRGASWPNTINSLEVLGSSEHPDSITKIDLSGMSLTTIPEEIYRYQKLKELILTNNRLTDVVLDCRKLPHLSNVVLNLNPLYEVKFIRPRQLEKINLQYTKIPRVPASLKQAKKLNSLWLGNNPQIHLKRRDYRRMKSINDLNLYACSLKTLSPSIKHLRQLQVLDLYHNELDYLPESIVKLKNLTHLAASNNRLLKIPERIGDLSKLRYLYLHHNRLSSLPESLARLDELQVLDLGFNWFLQYPDEANILSLEVIDLSSNRISSFPNSLLQLKKLRKVYLRGNPFLASPHSSELTGKIEQLKVSNREVFH